MIVISEATFSREVVVEKLQVSVLTKLLPVWLLIWLVNWGKISSHERVGSTRY